jgi:hypothetical protein
MSVQADLAPIPLGEFNERVRGELIPLNRQFSYFIAGLLLSEEDVRDYLEEPAAALPPEIVNRLPHVTVLLVPFLSRVNGKAARDGDLAAGLVCFDKPAETKMVWAASAAFHDEAVLAFAIKNLDVADYHYHFYHHLATSMASLLKPEELREYYGVLREELEHHANGEVDEESSSPSRGRGRRDRRAGARTSSRGSRRPSLRWSASGRDRSGVLQSRAGDLGRVDDAGGHQVFVLAGGGVEAEVGVRRWRGPSRTTIAPSKPALPDDLAQRLLAGARDDVDADLLVAIASFRPSRPSQRAAERRRRPGRCLLPPPRGWHAGRPRRGPSSPSSRSRWRRRP